MRIYITPEQYEIAKSNGICKNTLNSRVFISYWDIEKAITTPVGSFRKKYESKYSYEMEIAKKRGICKKTFYRRLERGWSPHEACMIKLGGRR